MTERRRQWKKASKGALRGRWMLAITAMILTSTLSTVASNLTSTLFPGEGMFTLVLAELFAFIVSVVMSVLMAGYSYMMLRMARRQDAGLGDLLYFFKNNPDRVIVAGFVLVLIQWITSIPSMVYSYVVPVGDGELAALQWQTGLLRWMVLALLLQEIVSMAFTFAYFLLADHPEMEGFAALKTSAKLMKGNYLKYILLQVSFFPLIFLSFFSFGIALFWIMPYMKMATAVFYRDVIGEFDYMEAVYGVAAVNHELNGQNAESTENDDYNAEA